MVYTIVAFRRLRRPTGYQPVRDDWLWHIAFPLGAYTLLVVLAFVLPRGPARALFGVGAVAVLRLFIGIRNAWDPIT